MLKNLQDYKLTSLDVEVDFILAAYLKQTWDWSLLQVLNILLPTLSTTSNARVKGYHTKWSVLCSQFIATGPTPHICNIIPTVIYDQKELPGSLRWKLPGCIDGSFVFGPICLAGEFRLGTDSKIVTCLFHFHLVLDFINYQLIGNLTMDKYPNATIQQHLVRKLIRGFHPLPTRAIL